MLNKKMVLSVIILVFVIVVVFLVKIGLGENPRLIGAQVKINKTIYSVELATSTLAQARGLSGRATLAANTGMLFIFNKATPRSFWMKDMRFPLDILWLDQNQIIGFAENVPVPTGLIPPVVTSPAPANLVLEVNAGEVQKNNFQVGDQVEVIR